MNLQTCKTFCSSCLPSAEQQQQHFVRKNIAKHASPSKQSNSVFSFKLQSHRQYHFSDKNIHKLKQQSRGIRLRSAQIGACATFRQNVGSVSPPPVRYFSPERKEQTSLQPIARPVNCLNNYTLQSLISPRVLLHPKVAFHFGNHQVSSLPTSKMVGKRLRTNQQETQYSSKHSQVVFRSGFEVPDSSSWVTFQKSKDSKNPVSFKQFKEGSQSSLEVGESLQTISQHIPSSQEHSHSPTHLEYYRSGVTMQTIVTSTEIKSRNSSRFSNQFQLLREARDEKQEKLLKEPLHAPQLSFDIQTVQQHSIAISPSAYFSPRDEPELPNDPNLFEGTVIQNVSPRVSVLSLSQHNNNKEQQQEEELRDVIDHNFLVSPSHNNSAKVSLVPSLKNVSDHQNSQRQWRRSLLHSRQGSWQLGPLMSTRAKFQRTNTIQSMESFSSEMISCLDIKFMQKNKGRRGVSRLL